VFAYGWQLPIARSVMGSKLENLSTGVSDRRDDGSDQEFLGGVAGRRKQQKNKKVYEIKTNIEGSQIWNDRDRRD
jgi:hypothetical protein